MIEKTTVSDGFLGMLEGLRLDFKQDGSAIQKLILRGEVVDSKNLKWLLSGKKVFLYTGSTPSKHGQALLLRKDGKTLDDPSNSNKNITFVYRKQ